MSSPKFLSPGAKVHSASDVSPPSVSLPAIPAARPGATTPTTPTVAAKGPPATAVRSTAIGRGTRGVNLDAKPGDDGLLAIVEARNSRGEAVAPPGDVSLVLIDPAVPGEGGRYARWDFSADDARALFREANGEAEAGSYFELPWPDGPPAHARLRLFVRVTAADGRQFQSDREVVIDLTGGGALLPPPMTPASIAPTSNYGASPGPFPVPTPAGEVVPAGAQSEPAGETGLRWGRRDASPSDATHGELPDELPLPVSAAVEAGGGAGFELPVLRPAADPAGPLLFPADGATPDRTPIR
jgi:hypothetical protein